MAAEQNKDAERATPEYQRVREEFELAVKLGGRFDIDSAMLNVDALLAARRPSAPIGEDGLPGLPQPMRKFYERPHGLQELEYYTADQMREFARDAVAAYKRKHAALQELVDIAQANEMEYGPQAAQGVKTWQERIGDALKADPKANFEAVKAESIWAELRELRAQLASERQAKEYEQRHAAESEMALAQVQAQLARQSQGVKPNPGADWQWLRDQCTDLAAFRVADASGDRTDILWKVFADRVAERYAAPPLSSEQQAAPEEVAKARWNAQADQFNQWSELGQDEKDALILAVGEQQAEKGEKA